MKKQYITIISVLLGTFLEWAEYTYYGYIASKIASLFFPQINKYIALLAAFGIFAVGYLMRPLGAICFGMIGDLYGRKKALILSIFLMGISTLGMGLLPTYYSIGLAAPILLLLLRCLQGFAVSSELNGAAIFLLEKVAVRFSYFAGSLVSSAAALGMVAGGLAAAIVARSHIEYAWRIPFFIAAGSCVLSFWLRKYIAESRVFQQYLKASSSQGGHLKTLWRNYKPQILLSCALTAYLCVLVYICNVYYVNFLITYGKFTASYAQLISASGELCTAILLPLIAIFITIQNADKFIKLSLISSILIAPFMFFVGSVQHQWILGIWLGQLLYGVINACLCAPIFKYLFDLFPINVRYSGSAIPWSISASVIGGTAPLLGQFFLQKTGLSIAPGLYLGLIAIIVLIYFGAEGRNRTDTMQASPDFESGASTSSATPAKTECIL
jgi:MHS family proline/betaine transporter-like MFS transporter